MPKIMLLQSRNVVASSGGAEKVLCQLSSALAATGGYEVLAVCNDKKHGKPFYPLHEKVRFINLGEAKENPIVHKIKRLLLPIFPRLTFGKLIRQENPDIIICFFIKDLFNVSFLQHYPAKKVLMLHCFPDFYFRKIKSYKRKLYKKMIESCAYVQVLSPKFIGQVTDKYNVSVRVISNMIDPPSLSKQTPPHSSHKIICVGALIPDKRPDILLRAFTPLDDWAVELWGAAKDKDYLATLKNIIKNKHLENKAFIKGVSSDMPSIYQSADIFAFPSGYEGFGLALAEAMSYGLPAIGFKDAHGVNDVITDGKDGFLVSSEAEFAEKLTLLMKDPALRKTMGKQAQKNMQRYFPDAITAQWEHLLKELLV